MKHLKLHLLAVAFLMTSIPLWAQKVTLDFREVALERVFNAITKQTGYVFYYTEPTVNPSTVVSLQAEDEELPVVLNRLFADSEIGYKINGRKIYLNEKRSLSKDAATPPRRVRGIVTDDSGSPVVGASVIIRGTTKGTSTDSDGTFELLVSEGDVLEISYVGYVTQNQVIRSQTELRIRLSESSTDLEDVVVIAYGTAQRKSIVGAVDQVASKTFENRSVGSTAQALQGAASNLIIQQASSNPNDSKININIRGISTLGDNTPLIVIDGLISTTSDLANLNPLDIDNVSVLKDAGSAAIYGSRSANGVVLITTKRGKLNEKFSVEFHGSFGMQVPEYTYEPVHGYQNAILRNIADYNVGNSLSYTPEQIQYYKQHGDGEWFLKQILKSAPQQNYNLNVSGGSAKSTYMMSFGYFDQRSNFVGPDYGIKRYNFRSNLSTEIKRLKLSSIISYARTEGLDHSGNRENMISDAARIPLYPDLSMKSSNGKYLLNNMLTEMNSLGMLEKGGTTESTTNNVVGNFDAEFTIIEGLKLKGTIGVNSQSYHRFIRRTPVDFYLDPMSETPSNTTNTTRDVQDYNEYSLGFNAQLLVDFNRTFHKVHKVTALFGVSNESLTRKANELRKQYVDPDLGIPTSETEVLLESYNTPSHTGQSSINSVFGRVGYSYADRYYVEATFRYDGSSKFAPEHRWGFFPSVSGGWRMSEEPFMSFYKERVGDLKFRASYGVLGNQSVGDYQYMTTYNLSDAVYAFNNQPVSGTSYALANPDLTWEKSKTFNVGLDLTFLKNRLSVSFDYYNKITSDILLNPIVPSTFGSSLPSYNAGEVRNRGWEVTVNFNGSTGEVQHFASFNIADSQNTVLRYGDEQIRAAEEFNFIIREGLPINSYFGYQRDGYFQNEEELAAGPFFETGNNGLGVGDVRYKDVSGNGTIGPEDRVVLGNAFPRYTFGLTYGLTWKGLDLNMLFQGVGRRTLGIRGELVDTFHFNWCYTMFEHQLDYWSPDNRDARYPRLAAPGSPSNTNNYRQSSDIYLYNGAYFRMKSLTIGYTLPGKWLSRLGVEKLRIYFNAENVFTISAVKFVDPEHTSMDGNMSGGASSGRMYPTPRYFGGGIDLKF